MPLLGMAGNIGQAFVGGIVVETGLLGGGGGGTIGDVLIDTEGDGGALIDTEGDGSVLTDPDKQ